MTTPATRVDDLTARLADGHLTDAEHRELAELLADPALAERHAALLATEADLRADRPMPSIEDDLLDAIDDAQHPEPAWLDAFGSRTFWRALGAAAVLLVSLVLAGESYYRSRTVDPVELLVLGRGEANPGDTVPYRVLVRDRAALAPLGNARVTLAVHRLDDDGTSVDGAPLWSGEATTGDDGLAFIEPTLDLPEGRYRLEAHAVTDRGQSRARRPLRLRRSFRVLLTTDKPLYQPGQTMRLRALALGTSDRRPAANRPLTLTVHDAKGNKVFKRVTTTSAHGIASADFALADQVNVGRYRLVATLDDTTSEKTVTVDRYTLPKYTVSLATTAGFYLPGQTARGTVRARYTFGKPVAGRVVVRARRFVASWQTLAEATGTLGPDGTFAFAFPLAGTFFGTDRHGGDATVLLTAEVVDTAGHTQRRSLERVVARAPLRVAVIPESGRLVAGVRNRVLVVTSTPDGRPAPARVTLMGGGVQASVTTSRVGVGAVDWEGPRRLQAEARTDAGARATVAIDLDHDDRPGALLLRTDRAIYAAGTTARLHVFSRQPGRVFLDVVAGGRTVQTATVTLTGGRAEHALDLDPSLGGTLELHAYRVGIDGVLTGDAKLIQVQRPSDLQVKATLDRDTYRPAEKAILQLAVTRQGKPVAAALGLSAVDEAVFAIAENRPGLAQLYFALQEELLTPRYQLVGATAPFGARATLAAPRDTGDWGDRQAAGAALVAAAEPGATPSLDRPVRTYEDRLQTLSDARKLWDRLLGAMLVLVPLLLAALAILPLTLLALDLLIDGGPRTHAGAELADVVRRPARNLALWWAGGLYLPPLVLILTAHLFDNLLRLRHDKWLALGCFAATILLVIWQQWSTAAHLRRALSGRRPGLARAAGWLPVCYSLMALTFGLLVYVSEEFHPRPFASPGPLFLILAAMVPLGAAALAIATGAVASGFDRSRGLYLAATRTALVGLPLVLLIVPLTMVGGLNEAAPGAQVDGEARNPFDVTGSTSDGFATGADPRVRRHFPETLLWIPELITDAAGRARVEIPLADSITTWRLAVDAVTADGALGATGGAIRVFQPFFVELDLPRQLTQNDRITVPVAVYNYLDEPQQVALTLRAADWYRLDGEASRTITIGPRQVTSVPYTLVATRAGHHSLLVTARGSALSDAVERPVEVAPDGRRVDQSISGRFTGSTTRTVTLPADAIDGGSDLHLKLYPGAFSEVVEGLDAILRMPHGCFEQTSSATYPNALVLAYLRQQNRAAPEIELKATKYLHLGYQRLLSFEVSGGGFDWYGKAPADVALSAYGLMEFADMARVMDVDPAVLRRTRSYLMRQQQEDGSFDAKGRFGSDAPIAMTAYVAWALASSDTRGRRSRRGRALDRALSFVDARLDATTDAYAVALAANALSVAKHPAAKRALRKLATLVEVDAAAGTAVWKPTGQGMTYSVGDSFAIETTALAAQAYLTAGHDVPVAHQALAWIAGAKDVRGTWHSTQATIQAIRALLAGAGSPTITEPTTVLVSVNGAQVQQVGITPETADVLRLVDLRAHLRPGANTVTLGAKNAPAIVFQLVASHHVPWGEQRQPPGKDLDIDVRYGKTTIARGTHVDVRVRVAWQRRGVAKMTLLDLGVPPGFDLERADLDALVRKGTIGRYESHGRQLTIYLRDLASGAPLELRYRLRARYPLTVKTPRSAAYQYYQPEVRDVSEPVTLTVR